jgi:hypothetical protein
LSAFILTGLFFMLVPGTFLGVVNLIQVTSRTSVSLVAPEWLQAHGHAQVFGWIGTFVLGIGLYSLPQVRAGAAPPLASAWACWGMWTSGVALRWFANVYGVAWRPLLPMSAGLELAAFLLFLRAVSRHPRPDPSQALDAWVKVVLAGTIGLTTTLVANFAACVWLAWRGSTPALPHTLDQRFLVLVTWGWLAPCVWGFSTKWLPVLLALRPSNMRRLAAGLVVNTVGVLLSLAGFGSIATLTFVAATVLVASALHIFGAATGEAKTRGVHPTFPFFVRLAYAWLIVAAILGVCAARFDVSGGVWGASRHAFTVGFISVMVFAIGQRVLPAFAGQRPLWSPRLMFAALSLLTLGCALRVSAEVVAYQRYASWAWNVLPISAVIELLGVTIFAVNLGVTLLAAEEDVEMA